MEDIKIIKFLAGSDLTISNPEIRIKIEKGKVKWISLFLKDNAINKLKKKILEWEKDYPKRLICVICKHGGTMATPNTKYILLFCPKCNKITKHNIKEFD